MRSYLLGVDRRQTSARATINLGVIPAWQAERVERDREMEIKTLKEQVYSQAANLVSDKMNRL